MILTNLKIVLPTRIIPNGYLRIEDGHIAEIGQGAYTGNEPAEDKDGLVAFPGFIDIHIHGSVGIDFMDAKEEDYPVIAEPFFHVPITERFWAKRMWEELPDSRNLTLKPILQNPYLTRSQG